MKIEGLLKIAKVLYDTKDENALVFLESIFRVIFSGEFDKTWLEENIQLEFENISSVEIYYDFISLFEFEFDKDENVIIDDNKVDDMLKLAILLSIYVEFEFNFYYFINEKRDFISLIINNGMIYFSGFKVHGELEFITQEVEELLDLHNENFEIESFEQIQYVKYKVKEILSNDSLSDSNIIESWKFIEQNILLKGLDLLINKYTYVLDPLSKQLVIPIIVKYIPLYNKDTGLLDIVRVRLTNKNNIFKWDFDQVQKEIKFFFRRN